MPQKNTSRRGIVSTTFTGSVAGESWTSTQVDGWTIVDTLNKSWVNTPNFKERKRMGTLPSNPFSYERFTAAEIPSGLYRAWRMYDNDYTVRYKETHYILPLIYEADFDGALVGQASLRALDMAKGITINAPVFIGELNKTCAMVASTATNLVYALRALKRGRLGEAGDHLGVLVSKRTEKRFIRSYGADPIKTASNGWLQLQYGWKPLMSELRNAVHTLGDMPDTDPSRHIVVRGSVSSTSTEVDKDQVFFTRDQGVYQVKGSIIRTYKKSARCTWRCLPSQNSIPAKVGLLNPLEVAWELVPLSFVADWFFPIGSYLSAFSTMSSYTTDQCTIGEKVEMMQEHVVTHVSPASATISGYSGNAVGVKLKRYPVNRPPWSINADFPTSVPQALSALALLAQAFR